MKSRRRGKNEQHYEICSRERERKKKENNK